MASKRKRDFVAWKAERPHVKALFGKLQKGGPMKSKKSYTRKQKHKRQEW